MTKAALINKLAKLGQHVDNTWTEFDLEEMVEMVEAKKAMEKQMDAFRKRVEKREEKTPRKKAKEKELTINERLAIRRARINASEETKNILKEKETKNILKAPRAKLPPRPNNVLDDEVKLPKKKNTVLLKDHYMDPMDYYMVDPIEDNDKKVLPGKYIVSFSLVLLVKDRGYSTRLVTENFTSNGKKTEKEIADEVAQNYIVENEAYLHDYNDNDVEILSKDNLKFTSAADVALREIFAKAGHPLQYKIFPADAVINKNKGECALDIIMAAAVPKWPKFTREQLIAEMKAANEKQRFCVAKGVSTTQAMNWAKSRKTVSMYALNMFHQVYEHTVATNRTDFSVCFVMNNGHFYSITDPDQKLHIARAKKLDLQRVQCKIGQESECYMTLEEAMGGKLPSAIQVHVETDDLSAVLQATIKQTGHIATAIMPDGPLITAFKHPVTDHIYIASKDYMQRKEVCEKSLKETEKLLGFSYIGFVWRGQSWAEIFQAWQDVMVGDIPVSNYSEDSLMIREQYPQSAYVAMARTVDEDEMETVQALDIDKCYSSVLLTNLMPYPIESVFDDIKARPDDMTKLPCGKAYVARSFMLGDKKFSRSWLPAFFVDYCLNEGVITLEDVTHVQESARTLDGTVYRDMTAALYTLFPQEAKKIVNNGIGALGRRFVKSGSVAITDNFETALGMVDEDPSIRLSEIGSFWFLRKEKKKLMHSGHVGIREHVVCCGHIKLNEMEKKLKSGGCEIIAWNTDSIKVICPDGKTLQVVEKAIAKPGDICPEERCNLKGQLVSLLVERPAYEHRELRWKELQPIELAFDECNHRSMMVTGGPGFGKSYTLNRLERMDTDDELKTVKLTWTKTAAHNISGETLDHVFPKTATRDEWIQKGMTFDALYIDEFSIIPERWWSFFLQLKMAKPSLKFRLFGDPNQLHSCEYKSAKLVNGQKEKEHSLWFHYHQTKAMHTLVDGYCVALSYVSGAARYDADLKMKIDSFESTKTLAAFQENRSLFTPEDCLFNIVKTAGKRDKINSEWVEALAPAKTFRCGHLKLWRGMYLISHSNSGEIVNSTRYKVLNLCENLVGLKMDNGKKIAVEYKTIEATCEYGYADTVMRIISRTLTGRFNIHEVDKMEWNELYVALSRAKTASSIRLDISEGFSRTFEMAKPPAIGIRVVTAPQLFDGSLYSRTDGKFTYVGKTIQEPEKREAQHKDAVSKKVAEWEAETLKDGGKIEFAVLETYKIKDEKQLIRREYQLIAAIPAELCMNTCGAQKAAEEKVATAIEAVEVDYSRFKISDDPKNKRFRIRWRVGGIAECKAFFYKRMSKEDALRAAEEFRAVLVKKNFI